MILKLHKKDESIIAAVCDSDLLGKKYEEGNLQLDLTSDFYNGEEKDNMTVGDTIRNADHVNLVGENAVKLGLEEGIIDEEHIKKIAGIPYAQAVLVNE